MGQQRATAGARRLAASVRIRARRNRRRRPARAGTPNPPRVGVRMILILEGVRMIPIPKGVRMILVPKGVRMIPILRALVQQYYSTCVLQYNSTTVHAYESTSVLQYTSTIQQNKTHVLAYKYNKNHPLAGVRGIKTEVCMCQSYKNPHPTGVHLPPNIFFRALNT
jgi:hypothetical protein